MVNAVDNVWDVLQKEVPTRIDELITSLNTCASNINAIRALLSSKAQKYDKLDQLDEMMRVVSANREMLQIENYLNALISNLDNSVPMELTEGLDENVEDVNDTLMDEDIVEEDEETVEEDLADDKADYSQYLVDQSIPYKLTEDFKNTSPCAFSFEDEKYLVDNWYEITIKVCEILYKKNSRLFSDIVGSCAIKGRKNAYIAFANEYPAKSIGVPKPLLDTDIVVEQRLSANQHMIVVKRLLDKFRIPRTAINIYLESDRKPKHGQIPIGKFLNGEFNKKKLSNEGGCKSVDSPEKKIGEYVRDYFTVYFADKTKEYDITNFLNKYWCNEHLGICYPLLKEIDETKPVSEQKNYNNEYARYWIKPILEINGKKYIMCSQWFKGFQEKFDKWVESESVTYHQIMPTEKRERKKETCINYDFKKNQCMCTDSVVFTQRCENIGSCEYYKETTFPIYVVPKHVNKSKKCPCCNNVTEKEFVVCTYLTDDREVKNKLLTYRCDVCDRNYIADTLYTNYTKSKDVSRLDVTFVRNI